MVGLVLVLVLDVRILGHCMRDPTDGNVHRTRTRTGRRKRIRVWIEIGGTRVSMRGTLRPTPTTTIAIAIAVYGLMLGWWRCVYVVGIRICP